MTQLEFARQGKITPEMRQAAKRESREPEFIRRGIARGRIVLPKNVTRQHSGICAVGEGLSTKINANIGTSKDSSDINKELEKLKALIALGADAVMDLSTGDKIVQTRKRILKASTIPVGTVPIYEIIVNCIKSGRKTSQITADEMLSVLERQAKEGVDFFTVHAGITRQTVRTLKENPRVLDIVSRGGAFLADWILENDRENPFYEHFDRVLEICRKYDVTLSLGDGMRPGSVKDATDTAQLAELVTLGELQKISVKKGVQVMIEGPGHVPINQVQANVVLQKSICDGAPFYVLGPLVTDIAPGYDHITSAIGGTLAGAAGADFLCYVTPAEHLRLPTLDDVKEGVIAAKIAAHAADIAKGVPGAIERDIKMSKARRDRDWAEQFRLAINREKPLRYRKASTPGAKDVCTMCGDYCSIKISEKCFRTKKGK